jgi:hypothetical protein
MSSRFKILNTKIMIYTVLIVTLEGMGQKV